MTDFSQYSDSPNAGRARLDAALSGGGALCAKFQEFVAKEENRAELRRLMFVFSIQYALVAVFVVSVVASVSAQLNFH